MTWFQRLHRMRPVSRGNSRRATWVGGDLSLPLGLALGSPIFHSSCEGELGVALESLTHSMVFLYFFVLVTEEGFLISPCYSLELCIQMGISFLFSFTFHFSSFPSFCKASSDSHFAFLHFFFLGSDPINCSLPGSSVHGILQARILEWVAMPSFRGSF